MPAPHKPQSCQPVSSRLPLHASRHRSPSRLVFFASLAPWIAGVDVLTTTSPAAAQAASAPATRQRPEVGVGRLPEDLPDVHGAELAGTAAVVTGFRRSLAVALERKRRAV